MKNTKSPDVNKLLDEMSLTLFGRARSVAIAGNGCVRCGKSATEFKDARSKKEFDISGLCQTCQDLIFG